jgi:hypothetical protein
MSAHDLALDVLIGAAVAGELLCCVGLVVMRDEMSLNDSEPLLF